MMAKKYDTAFIKEMMDGISPLTKMEVTTKMQLAARIADLIVEKGWSKSEFAAKVGKQPSEISKWLSGTHNFTIDTLCEIAVTMDIEFAELLSEHKTQITIYKQTVSKQIVAEPSPYYNFLSGSIYSIG
jgi:transcriptional regulator with XRE-family HTH domain